MSENGWGEEILGLYVETVEPYIEDHWQVLRLREHDFNRRQYGREFELKKSNPSGTQGWVCGTFTRASLTGLRDMLTAVLDAEDRADSLRESGHDVPGDTR